MELSTKGMDSQKNWKNDMSISYFLLLISYCVMIQGVNFDYLMEKIFDVYKMIK